MTADFFKILFPQWQGTGNRKGAYHGAHQIFNQYFKEYAFTAIPVTTAGDLQVEKNILGYSQVLTQLKNITATIQEARPDRLLTIGGDCGIELAPVSYLNKRYDGDLALIWFDAHGDLNTPDSTPSRHFHGMPVRCLLGEGEPEIVSRCFSRLEPSQVILAGARDLDPPEERFIAEAGIEVVPVERLQSRPAELVDLIKSHGFSNVHIHVDLDVLDMGCFPHVTCPTAGGLDMDSLLEAVAVLEETFHVAGFSLLEFAPLYESGVAELVGVVDFIQRLTQQEKREAGRRAS